IASESIVSRSPTAIRIQPPPVESAAETIPISSRRKPPVPKTTNSPLASAETAQANTTPAAVESASRTKRTREQRPVINVSAIEQAKALLTSQREQLVKTKDLIAALRRQQKQSRVVAATLAQLKELQKIA